MNFDEYYYIPLANNSKRPIKEWDGWPIDPEHENIHTYAETQEIDHKNWAIVGHESGELLVIDVDLYKMDEEMVEHIDKIGWNGLLDESTVVKSQSGGLHLYVLTDVQVHSDDENLGSIEHVDLKGDIGKGYSVAPFSPGYDLAVSKDPMPVSRETLESLPVIVKSYDFPDDVDLDKIDDMDEMEAELEFWRKQDPPTPCVKQAKDVIKNGELDRRESAIDFLQRIYRIDAVKNEEFAQALEESDFMDHRTEGDFISVYEIVDRSEYPPDTRQDQPNWLHDTPSSSEANFMVDDGGETFRCWRHDVTGNVLHLIGVKYGIIDCGDWNGRISSEKWKRIFNQAEQLGLDVEQDQLSCDDVKEMGWCPYACGEPFPKRKIFGI